MGAPVVEGDDFERPDDPVPAHLDMVVLSAHDVPGLRAFYRGLGWEERAGASDSLAAFDLDGTRLTLYADPSVSPAVVASTEDRPGVTLVLRIDNADHVNRFFGTALHAGATSVADPQDQTWGGRSAVVADPEGNRWELLWMPPAGAAGPGTAAGGGSGR